MSDAILNHVSQSSIKSKVPLLKPGNTVSVFQRIKEGDKERTQIFEGLVIKISAGAGPNKTFTVRKVVDGIGVEKTFPYFSPNIEKVEVVKTGKVRRAKLYFMRERSGKSARLKESETEEVTMWGSEAVEETTPELAPEATSEEAETPAEVETEAEMPATEETSEEEVAEIEESNKTEEA